MKLICTAGLFPNKSYDVFPPGISIGREDDNDIVLRDEEVSRYHAKIEYHDGLWYVHDMNSSNGVLVNMKKIDQSATLSVQDDVKVGKSVFRFTDDSGLIQREEKSGGGVSGDGSKQKARLVRLALAGGLALLIVLVVVALVLTQKQAVAPPAPAVDLMALAAEHPMELYFEKVSTDVDRAFRYALQLKERELTVTVDDAVNDTRIEEKLNVDDEQLRHLREKLLTPTLLTDEVMIREGRRQGSERSRLLVRAGPVGNYLVVENSVIPESLEEAVDVLSQFVQQELGVFAEAVPREEVLERAEEFYLNAIRLEKEAVVEPSNLYNAILGYRHVVERLKWMADKPAFYQDAVERMAQANQSLQSAIDSLRKEAVTYRHTGQPQMAKTRLQKILGMIPDNRHPEVIKARSEIMSIDRELRN